MAADESSQNESYLVQPACDEPAANDILAQYGITLEYLEAGITLSGFDAESHRELVLAVMEKVRKDPAGFIRNAMSVAESAARHVAAMPDKSAP